MKIILFGLRRSGTSLAFNIFRINKKLCCFYEPLHPNLVSKGGLSCLDRDKKGVYSEYKAVKEELTKQHEGLGAPEYDVVEEFICNNLTNRHFAYLNFLFDFAENVLIQPVRLNYQLYQLRERFPDAIFVWVVRQPGGFINSVLKYRPSLLTYHDACIAGSHAIKNCKKNVLFRMTRGWNAFDDPWSQIAAANFIVQSRPFFRGLINAPAWIKLLALWYDHYRFVTEFINSDAQRFFIFSYDRGCRSEDYIRELMANLKLDYPEGQFSNLIDNRVIQKQNVSKIDISDGEIMIQEEFEKAGLEMDLSYRQFIG